MHREHHEGPTRASDPTIAERYIGSGAASRGHAGLSTSALILAATGVALGLARGWFAPWIAAGLAVAIGVAHVVLEHRRRPRHTGPLDIAGLAAMIDRHRNRDGLTSPVAAIVLELRGIAADTIVDGPAAWAEPIAVVARRLASADVGDGLAVARLGPHTFGIVMQSPDRAAALAAAESLVALCRMPIRTATRELRIDAAAGVSHAATGELCTGEELVRAADASLRVDGTIASPVAMLDSRLLRHARRVVEVETEIRHSLDVDLLTARLLPVADVHRDEIVGLRTAYDWTSISNTEPAVLTSIADALGLRRSIETQYLMRSISAASELPGAEDRRVTATLDAHRLADPRAVSQLELLLRVCGLDPTDLVLELDDWAATSLDDASIVPLQQMGVGIGLSMSHNGAWPDVPETLLQRSTSISITAADVLHPGRPEADVARIDALTRLCGGNLDRVTVGHVNSAAVALELSAAGLPLQWGDVHGAAMAPGELHGWLADRCH